ncbi:hypothetical protein O9929_25950 [Vibrio lentus]|nr:hypothetical protein [Vibrio lentus]
MALICRVAHECIIDIRPLKEDTGISEEDIAKRLMDFGFTRRVFPVAGTLMVEPTESEDLEELDRFVAMIAIRHEMAAVKAGEWPLDNNPSERTAHYSSLSFQAQNCGSPYLRTGLLPIESNEESRSTGLQ